jgi:hypothetical protein
LVTARPRDLLHFIQTAVILLRSMQPFSKGSGSRSSCRVSSLSRSYVVDYARRVMCPQRGENRRGSITDEESSFFVNVNTRRGRV